MKPKASTLPGTIESALFSAIPEDRYQVTGMLGEGTVSSVFRALELIDGRALRPVALKVYQLKNHEAKARVEREIALLAPLSQSPHILGLLQSHFSPDGKVMVLVLPYLEAQSVEALVEHAGRALPDNVIAAIAIQICSALAYIHELSIVHRDVKPSNLLVTTDGIVRLCDFGIAISLSASDEGTITDKGTFVGTLRYAPPEAFSGRLPTTANDIYSFGVTLLFMVLGRQPFESVSVPSLVQQILTRPLLRELPASKQSVWGGLLSAILSTDPDKRLTAKQAADLLRERFPELARDDQKVLSDFLQNSGGFRLPPPPNPPVALSSSPDPDGDGSLKGLIQSLASQIVQVQAAVADMTAKFKKQELLTSADARTPGPEVRIESAFTAVRRRLELNWRVSLLMTCVLFSLFVAMMVLAVVFGVIYQKSYWGIVFGGASAMSLMTVIVWKPMDKMLFATIATQQLELIQLNYQRALSGTREERREAFRDVSTQLNSLLTKSISKLRV